MVQIHIGSKIRKLALACLTVLLNGCLASLPSEAQTYTLTLLHSFAGTPQDGASPAAGMVFDAAGNLYGTTPYGGGDLNYGTVFKYSTSGLEGVLFQFNGDNGAYPQGPLAIDANGNLYGTTYEGGASDSGTVFEISAAGSESTIYDFPYPPAQPIGGLALDSAGNLYGVDLIGAGGSGDLYELTQSGVYTTLYSFNFPYQPAGPFRDNMGNFFGTSAYGGDLTCPTSKDNGCGFVYEYTAAGNYSVLHAFTNQGIDGFFPFGTPVMDSQGNLYGTTYAGGNHGLGVVFELSPPGKKGGAWKETLLHVFNGGTDGAHPSAGLVLDSQGNLYGTTYQGGTSQGGKAHYGTIFMIRNERPRKETILHYFAGAPNDGAYPAGALVLDSLGNLYGTTQAGGSSNLGTLYKLSP